MKPRKAENINCNSYLSTIQLVVSNIEQQFHHFLPNNHGNEMRLMRKHSKRPDQQGPTTHQLSQEAANTGLNFLLARFFFLDDKSFEEAPPESSMKKKDEEENGSNMGPLTSCPHHAVLPPPHPPSPTPPSTIRYWLSLSDSSALHMVPLSSWWNNLLKHILPSREGEPNLCKGTETSPRATSFSLRGASC